jgi:hypothetical protein
MAISGQKRLDTAGTAEPLGDLRIDGPLMVKALVDNTGTVYVGNDGLGDVDAYTGIELDAGEAIVFEFVGYLGSLWLDADLDNEGVSWSMLNL